MQIINLLGTPLFRDCEFLPKGTWVGAGPLITSPFGGFCTGINVQVVSFSCWCEKVDVLGA